MQCLVVQCRVIAIIVVRLDDVIKSSLASSPSLNAVDPPRSHQRRKKEARAAGKASSMAQKLHGLKAKMYNQKRFKEKAQMKKT